MNIRIENKNINELIPSDYNPRVDLRPGDSAYKKLKRSINEFGLVEPIVFNERTGRVVSGHQRLKILRELGWNEVPVSVVSLSEKREKALNVALNKIVGDWDNLKLKDLLEELESGLFDVTLTGFDEDEIENLMKQFTDENDTEISDDEDGTEISNDENGAEIGGENEDENNSRIAVKEDSFDPNEAAEKIEEPITKPGDLWRLGRHFLMVGDATKIEDVEFLMGGEKADMIFTDPPYNVDYVGKTEDSKKIINDNMTDANFYQFLLDAFENMYAVAKEGSPIYVFHADLKGHIFRNAFMESGFLLKQCLIWVKNHFAITRQDYHWKHEPILYGWKPGAAHKWYGGRKQSTVIENPADLVITPKDDHVLITFNNGAKSTVVKTNSYEILYTGSDEHTTTWFIDKPIRNADHPTMKPVSICARAIQNSSEPGDRVLDPFGGSGSTLLACEQTDRICYMMEYDPVYAEVIIRRWEAFTGQKAVKERSAFDGRSEGETDKVNT